MDNETIDRGTGEDDENAPSQSVVPGALYLVGTPIGNLEDITYRAVRILKQVDKIAAEDTRRAKILCSRYDICTPTLSYFEGNESRRIPLLTELLRKKQSIAVISDAGMPCISDPGYRLVNACHQQGIPVDVVPGPSAVSASLIVSGLSTSRYRFVGFPPRKGRARRDLFKELASERDSVIMFESRFRIEETLRSFSDHDITRPMVLVRELTKRYQQTVAGNAADLLAHVRKEPPKGEITLVISGEVLRRETIDDRDEEIRRRLRLGQSPRQIAHEMSEYGQTKRSTYQRAVVLSKDHSTPE